VADGKTALKTAEHAAPPTTSPARTRRSHLPLWGGGPGDPELLTLKARRAFGMRPCGDPTDRLISPKSLTARREAN